MKATVMTTGPGVIIATATASRNWRSVSQWSCVHDARRAGTARSPARCRTRTRPPRRSRARCWSSSGRVASRAVAASVRRASRAPARHDRASRGDASPRGARTSSATTPAARNSQTISDSVQAVATRARRRRATHSSRSFAERSLTQLERAARDDRDDRGADAVERALHPRHAAEADVQRRQRPGPSGTTAGRTRAPTSVAPAQPPLASRGRSRAAPPAAPGPAGPAPGHRRSPSCVIQPRRSTRSRCM